MALSQGLAQAQTTERVSVDSGGAEGNGNSHYSTTSADGRFVAFNSFASNLVAGDTNVASDIFVRDRQAGTTERVNVTTGGAQGANSLNSFDASISADGRFVAFSSLASNLVAGDTNGFDDIFVHDRQSGTTERVSVSTGGAQVNGHSRWCVISADGRFVAFHGFATNLVAGDTNATWDIFVRDRQSGTTERVSVSTGGAQGNSPSIQPAISADGRFVAFDSIATNLVAGDTNATADIFVHDRQSGTTDRVSVATGGAPGNDYSVYASVSADGRFVTFYSFATNLVAGDTNATDDVFVHDRQSGTTELVSVSTGGALGNGSSVSPAPSADGRFVTFASNATNLVAGDTNGFYDVFVRDRQSGTTERVSIDSAGAQGNAGTSVYPYISADGRIVAFQSDASNLVAGDTNGFHDAFVRDRGGQPPPSPFCFGDGTGTACPCGNGTAGNGCPSSVNASGANLAASGNSSLANDTLVLSGTGMPDSTCLYFQGTTQISTLFGDGLRCAGGVVSRLGIKTNAGGASQYPVGGDQPVSVKGNVTAPGMRTYQTWYRNAAAFCTPATFNLTNGLEVTWTP